METPGRKLRFGVLGYARIARTALIPAILRSRNSVVHALASGSAAKLEEARSTFPQIARTYGDYAELLRDEEVDAVYIPLPNALHCEWAIRAAEHGKHVLCEKPLALNAREARAMIAAAKENGVVLMEAFMYRYTERTRMVRELIRSGTLGELKFVQASFRFLLANPASIKLRPELGGGALYDVGCYPVNFAGMVADSQVGGEGLASPESVAVECVRTDGIDEILSALMRYPSGLVAAVHCGFNAHMRVAAEIIGTEGVLEVPDTFLDNAGSLTLTRGEQRREIQVPASDRFRSEVEDFADAVLLQRPTQLGLAETQRNMEVMDQLFTAAG